MTIFWILSVCSSCTKIAITFTELILNSVKSFSLCIISTHMAAHNVTKPQYCLCCSYNSTFHFVHNPHTKLESPFQKYIILQRNPGKVYSACRIGLQDRARTSDWQLRRVKPCECTRSREVAI